VLAMIECPADEFIPLPVKKDKPVKTTYRDIRQRAKAACNAALQLDACGYEDVKPNLDYVRAAAQAALRQATQGRNVTPEYVNAAMDTPEGAMYVETLLSAYDMAVVKDAKRLRNYVTNKLLIESENMDGRIRMRALELLGKISDVGLFTERTEITVNNRSTVELENSLRDKLRRLMDSSDMEDAKIIAPPVQIEQSMSARQALADF